MLLLSILLFNGVYFAWCNHSPQGQTGGTFLGQPSTSSDDSYDDDDDNHASGNNDGDYNGLSETSGWALRANDTCPESLSECGTTWGDFVACCPTTSPCLKQYNAVCCPLGKP